ncbi:MAG: hypothetical protein K6B64_05715 [Acholeplasmatales bacterium]|nr:hypothetical protein [Acholeplasmatales bacterium]
MKKFFGFLIALLLCFTLASCNPGQENNNNNNNNNNGGNNNNTSEVTDLNIHYRRWDANYEELNSLWVWPKDGDGKQVKMDKTDDFGIYATLKLADYKSATQIGFIVRSDSWAKDTYGADRFIDLTTLTADANNQYNVWIVTGDETIYTKLEDAFYDDVIDFEITYDTAKSNYLIGFKGTSSIKAFSVKKNDEEIFNKSTDSENFIKNEATAVSYNLGATMPNCVDTYTVDVEFTNGHTAKGTASINKLYAVPDFADAYTYTGQLGAIYTEEKTTFRVWSPVATAMKLRVYEVGTPAALATTDHPGSDTFEEHDMARGEKGTWEVEVSGNLEGKYYTYVVTNYKYKGKEVVDPYAKSTGVNGLRGMIVDFSKTNPEDWDTISVHEYPSTSLAVYETHVADLTSSDTWGGTAENAKKFKGFYEEGTTYTENGVTVTTGFDHIKELGVNAVQLIPVFDADNNEVNPEFNWGYNPLNYNSLDGIFSSNPYDGYEKIKEFKALVKAYNEAGINIIMDVVYNHVAGADMSNFDVLMPGYYFRYNGNTLSNGSGCGNETASNMPMFRKFMVDSTEFWATEYKLGGFRFDLMGLHDLVTMAELSNNLHSINEYITVYGEPWAGGTAALGTNLLAVQNNMSEYDGYGCFNDKLRDGLIKGGMSAATELGFATASMTYTAVTSKVNADNFDTYIAKGLFVINDGKYTLVDASATYDANAKYYTGKISGATKANLESIVRGVAGFVLPGAAVLIKATVTESTFAAGLYFLNAEGKWTKTKDTDTFDSTVQYYKEKMEFNIYDEAEVTSANFASKVADGLYIVIANKYIRLDNSYEFDSGVKYYDVTYKNNPSECVNYVTCHDNYTLYDRAVATGKKYDDATIKKMAILANSVVFTSQGISFMLAGEEFLRTKGGSHNSYNLPYDVNELDYSLKVKNIEMMDIYQKLIALKTGVAGFQLTDGKDCMKVFESVITAEDFTSFQYKVVSGDTEYIVIHHCGVESDLSVDLTGYTLYLDTLGEYTTLTGLTDILPYQTIIAYKNI